VAALKLSQVLGGGISHLGLTCGAVTGALLAISLNFGRSRAEDKAAKALTYELAQEFCRRFTEKHGSTNCSDLLGCSLKLRQAWPWPARKTSLLNIAPATWKTPAACWSRLLRKEKIEK